MGYRERNMHVITDLEKLLAHKLKKGISDKWLTHFFGYYLAFQRQLDKAAAEDAVKTLLFTHELDDRIDLEKIVKKSVKTANSVIIKELSITERMAELLKLNTLRKDADRVKKLRWNRTDGSISRDDYLVNLHSHRVQMKIEIERLISQGCNKTEIARILGISRFTVYNLLRVEDDLDTNEEAI